MTGDGTARRIAAWSVHLLTASGAAWALVYGETEVANNQVTLKPLRGDAAQRTIDDAELISFLAGFLAETQGA